MVGMIKKEDVEKVRAAADLYDIVSATVTLKPSGTGTFVGCARSTTRKPAASTCAPHSACGTASAAVWAATYSNTSNNPKTSTSAKPWNCSPTKYHIELHYENSGNGPNRENAGSKRTRLLEACEEAQRFFVSQILTKEALPARKLLGGRNFSQADCERFGCGYAPQGWDNLGTVTWPTKASHKRKSSTPVWPVKASVASTIISAAA